MGSLKNLFSYLKKMGRTAYWLFLNAVGVFTAGTLGEPVEFKMVKKFAAFIKQKNLGSHFQRGKTTVLFQSLVRLKVLGVTKR